MILLTYLNKKGFFSEFSDKRQLKIDLLSGLTVALALIPEAIAFSFVAKVDPMVGLHAAFIVGIITAIFGGRPGMISGATGAMAVVMTAMVMTYGIEYLFVTLVLAGVLQMLFGLAKMGKFVRLIPHPVMLGFVNGLAIIIFLSQIDQFKVNKVIDWEFVKINGDFVKEWISFDLAIIMWALILLTMAIMQFLPKFTKAIPSGLAAIGTVTLLAMYVPFLHENTQTIAWYLADNDSVLKGGLPQFFNPFAHISTWILETLKIIVPTAFALAIIGLTESLMTLSLIDEKTNSRGKGNKESIAQWVANFVCGFFGSMWGCAMIGQSMINISSGWRGRMSGISASIFLLLFIVFGISIISLIPIAALVGLMFMVVIGTFAWPTLKMLNKIPKSDAFVLIAVTVITVATGDLAIAVISGIIISALVFAWQKSTQISVRRYIDEDNITHYDLEWALFFGSIEKFKTLFDLKSDTKEVIIDFADSKIMDHSAIEAIDNLTDKYAEENKTLHIRHISEDCRKLIKNADKMVDINIKEDPTYAVADDKLA